MKRSSRLKLVFMPALAVAFMAGCAKREQTGGILSDTATQVSIIDALNRGAFEGQMPCENLSHYGNFGLGTFDGLDGELIMLSNIVYRADAAGKATVAPAGSTTPFATVTFFEPDVVYDVADLNQAVFRNTMNWKRTQESLVHAIRINGFFQSVRTRSVPRQTPPYPTLDDALKQQTTNELRDVAGTIVGFWYPDYLKNVNVAGFHLHFIGGRELSGGHVLDFELKQGRIELDITPAIQVFLPAAATAFAASP